MALGIGGIEMPLELTPWLIALALNSGLGLVAWLAPKKLLTPEGLLHAWALGVLIWGTLGWQGYLVVLFYFLVGSGVTRVGMARKQAAGIAEKRDGARGPENVWGSALAGAVCALGTVFAPAPLRELLGLGYVASFATKLSDTTASEVGKAYGQHTFLITTFKAVPRGTEGAVSAEGTLAGVVASLLQALVGLGVGLISGVGVVWCVVAALVATSVESVIGATLQSRFEWLTNELVNVVNTLIGAGVAMLLAWSLGS